LPFESAQFLSFVLCTLTAYWALSKYRTAQKWLLLAISLGFYSRYSWDFTGLLLASTSANWLISQRIIATTEKTQKRWLVSAVVLNLLFLCWFKYTGFFVDSFNDAFVALGFQAHLPVMRLLLPLGISFYTFQAIAYQVEIARGTGHPAKSLLDFMLFQVTFFQLVIGPILRGRDLLPQLEAPAPARITQLPRAISLILSGLFKRMVIASLLFSLGVSQILFAPDTYTASALWVGMIGYSIQIYCDFSGYTDLMRGIAMLFGFQIPDNFNRPYLAASVGDFWRRWHITFSNWLRDFIYFPLGGSRASRPRAYFNLFMTMFFCGIWHGASWGYIVWGTVHGLALVHYKYSLDRARDRGTYTKATPTGLRWLRGWLWTMGVVTFSRIPFVTADLGVALDYYRRMFTVGLEGAGFHPMLIVLIIVGFAMNFWGKEVRDWFVFKTDALPVPVAVVSWAILLFCILNIKPAGVLPNAYFNF
jgi:alginate O-acetyltransferase complex protein AlgI